MKLTRRVWALVAALGLNVVLVVMLTPLGFESRPTTDLKTVGVIAIGTVFVGLLLDVAAIILLFRKNRLASRLAMAGSIVFFFPNIADQTGSFFSASIPPVINTLEYILTGVLFVTLFLAWTVYKENSPSPA